MIRAIVVDDIKIIRDDIIQLLQPFSAELSVVAEANSVKSALEMIEKHKPDVLFLDVELKDGSSFELLKEIDYAKYKIIFITSYGHYAVRAFKYCAIDYLLKPVDPDDLKTAIEKLHGAIKQEEIEAKYRLLFDNLKSPDNTPEKIVLKTLDSIHTVAIKDIIRCESDNNYTNFYLVNGKKIMMSVTLKKYEELFSEHRFFRIHQSHLINIAHFDHLKKQNGLFVIMKDGTELPLASRKKSEFLRITS